MYNFFSKTLKKCKKFLMLNHCKRFNYTGVERTLTQTIRIGVRHITLPPKNSEPISIDELPQIRTVEKITSASKKGSLRQKSSQSLIIEDENSLVDQDVIEDRGAKTDKKAPSLFKTIRSMMDRYKDHVVLVQVGGFYELYFEHAEIYAPKLDIKVTQRFFKSTGSIGFAGFPYASLDKYLKILVNDLGYSVAIADQFANESGPGISRITRRVARIVTPGTLIDEALRNFQQNNYLLSISFPENPCKTIANPELKIGLAWSDVALGDFYVQETTLQNLMTNISSIKPSEILLNEDLASEQLDSGRWYPELAELKRFYVRYQNLPTNTKPMKSFYNMFCDDERTLDRCFHELSQKEISASISALYYISENLPDTEPNLALPERKILSSSMQIDSRTSDALELQRTFRDDKKTGSLLSSIRMTTTLSGTRLLSSWVSAPSTSVTEIKRRQKLVDRFKKRSEFRSATINQLKLSSDISRIVQRLSLGRTDVLELCFLAKTLFIVHDLKGVFEREAAETKLANKILLPLISKLKAPLPIAKEILQVIDEEALIRNMRAKELERDRSNEKSGMLVDQPNDDHALNAEDWVVRKESNQVLRKCHDEYEELLDKKDNLLKRVTDMFINCRSVELQLHKVYGYVVCVTGSQKALSAISEFPPGFRLLYSTKQSRYLYNDEWKSIGTDTQSHVDRIRSEENQIISNLRRKILQKTLEIRNVAHVLDYIDVLSSFAVLALEKNLTMPKVTSSTELNIVGGRHIVVEDGLKDSSRQFTSNDCHLHTPTNKESMWIVSGPNMGGKSTFLRQNAIIVIMAQMGSFVPADNATIGVVDKVFSRVGSADDLYRELSTFMVEMVETSFILKNATPRSLAILDEVGRGTSGKEGLSIAFATLLHLLKYNNCRCLFATHFGVELAELMKESDGSEKIGYYKTSIEKVNLRDDLLHQNFIFDHKLKPGISSKSHAIEVAQIAGFPEEAVEFAKVALNRLQTAV